MCEPDSSIRAPNIFHRSPGERVGRERYSWSKGGGRVWAVDCVTQKVVQIIGDTKVDLTCLHWAAMADKEVELYFFYRP
jgi:hypothetical protein